MKRLAIIFCSMLITINILPVTTGYFVYADGVIVDPPNGYSPSGLNDQVDAFKYYCKSRNLVIDGSGLDAITSFTTKVYQNYVQKLGLDINELQYQIYKSTGSGQKFYYTVSGISAMNRIFAEFLQNNDLEVGDQVDDKELYNGYLFNNQLVYVVKYNPNSNTQLRNKVVSIITEGTPLFSRDYIYSSRPSSFTVDNTSYTINYNVNSNDNVECTVVGANPSNYLLDTKPYGIGGVICYFVNNYSSSTSGTIYLGIVNSAYGTSFHGSENTWVGRNGVSILQTPNSSSKQNVNVYITTNNTTINNNNYEGDTIINNEGDIVNPTPQPTPIPDPNDDHTTNTPQINPSSPDSDANLTFPLLDLDLPSIDWSIGDLSHKFPFSIPFDLYNMFSVLNTEPQTPEIQGNIDLGIYQWDIDWDLHQFDDTAELLRNIEFVGFVIGLIFITRSLIKG